MEPIHIRGGYPLSGQVRIQGSKNAALPILAATVLIRGETVLENCPRIEDVQCMLRLLQSIGCSVRQEKGQIRVDAAAVSASFLPQEDVGRMRSSVMMMGALLGRNGQVHLSDPGGCVIGKRPIDIHLAAFAQMGVELHRTDSGLSARTEQLCGNTIRLPFPSVGATENVILAAVLARGETVLLGGAREPEIWSLCRFLELAGAQIHRDEADDSIHIQGVEALHGCTYRIPFDRIVAGTYLLGCMAAGGEISLLDVQVEQLEAVLEIIRQMGGSCQYRQGELRLKAPKRPAAIPRLQTRVYPGYPTDLQSQLLVVLALAKGESLIEETIFENRFRIVPQLQKMGARIRVMGNQARITGVEQLHGCTVTAEELRGGAALCMAGLAARGDTYIRNRHFIDRGYQTLEQDIRNLGGLAFDGR